MKIIKEGSAKWRRHLADLDAGWSARKIEEVRRCPSWKNGGPNQSWPWMPWSNCLPGQWLWYRWLKWLRLFGYRWIIFIVALPLMHARHDGGRQCMCFHSCFLPVLRLRASGSSLDFVYLCLNSSMWLPWLVCLLHSASDAKVIKWYKVHVLIDWIMLNSSNIGTLFTK